MKVHDLGELTGAVAVFGGPCSNQQATEAFYAEVLRRSVPPRNVICTGI